MRIDAVRDALDVRVGQTFRDGDAARLEEAVAALGPFSRVTIDFAAARECEDAAVVRLARMLLGLSKGEVSVRGLTLHHWKLLTYLQIRRDDFKRRAS